MKNETTIDLKTLEAVCGGHTRAATVQFPNGRNSDSNVLLTDEKAGALVRQGYGVQWELFQ